MTTATSTEVDWPTMESDTIDNTPETALVITTTHATDAKELAFVVDGEEFYLPKVVTPSVALRASKLMRTKGEAIASAYMMEQLLGAEQYDKLSANDDITEAQWVIIAKLVVTRALGPLEGKS